MEFPNGFRVAGSVVDIKAVIVFVTISLTFFIQNRNLRFLKLKLCITCCD